MYNANKKKVERVTIHLKEGDPITFNSDVWKEDVLVARLMREGKVILKVTKEDI